jgi:hypothetical protein
MGRWNPNYIKWAIDERQSSTNVVIVETDIGQGYAKFIGNPAGEHCLACEYVCTQLAEWLGLPTLDYGLVNVDTAVDSIRLYNGSSAKSGPAFITRREAGDVWDGSEKQLKKVQNPEDISRLVVFDTWVLNRDRMSALMRVTDNVLLSSEQTDAGKLRLVAIDHTHCLTDPTTISGNNSIDLNNLGDATVTEVFGLFREFRRLLDRSVVQEAAKRLKSLDSKTVTRIVESIPVEWGVSKPLRERLAGFILERAERTAESVEELVSGPRQTQKQLEFGTAESDE